MSKIKVKFRPSAIDGHPGTIVYVATHNRVTRSLSTNYKIFPNEWDPAHSTILIPSDIARRNTCIAIMRRIKLDILLFNRIISQFITQIEGYTSDNIISEFQCLRQRQSFFSFMQEVISRLNLLGSVTTSRNYQNALLSFSAYRSNEDILLPEISSSIIEEYQAWLISKGARPNTISFYMRILRATYKRAVQQGLVNDAKPFAKSFTKNEKTAKRALSISEIKKIKKLDLSESPSLEFVRDMFLFLFYCRGMNFIDAAYLQTTNIKDEHIVYRRHKTNQELRIGINKHISGLITRYHVKDSLYLLPILVNHSAQVSIKYESSLRTFNNNLKKIGQLAHTSLPLTTYVSRHSWATIAKSKGIPLSLISDALGHSSEFTTQIYLASISNNDLNRANDKILRDL